MLEQQILKIIVEAIKEVGEEDNRQDLLKPDKSTLLYGQNGFLDSLSLVRVISIVEEKINKVFHKEIVIASEKAMSLRNSPFHTVGSLTEFIEDLLSSEQNA